MNQRDMLTQSASTMQLFLTDFGRVIVNIMFRKNVCLLLSAILLLLALPSAIADVYEPCYLIGDTYKICSEYTHYMRNIKTGDYYYWEQNGDLPVDYNDFEKIEWKLWKMPEDYYSNLEHQKLTINGKEYALLINDKVREVYYNGKKDEALTELIDQAWQEVKSDSCDIYVFKLKFNSEDTTWKGQPSTKITAQVYCLDFRCSAFDVYASYPQEDHFTRDKTLDFPGDITYNAGNVNYDDLTNMLDVVILQRYIAGYNERINILTADANIDGIINMLDVVKMQRIIAKL